MASLGTVRLQGCCVAGQWEGPAGPAPSSCRTPVVKFDGEDTVEINASKTERADRIQLNSQRRGSLPSAAGNHREIGAIRPRALLGSLHP
jgi:hypothetical protein